MMVNFVERGAVFLLAFVGRFLTTLRFVLWGGLLAVRQLLLIRNAFRPFPPLSFDSNPNHSSSNLLVSSTGPAMARPTGSGAGLNSDQCTPLFFF